MRIHPFFSYFGSKWRNSRAYPPPLHDEIIEPFAGSAGYAITYPQKRVRLFDLYEPIVELWDWLIHVSEDEIRKLPLGPFHKDRPIESEVDSSPARTLIGFWSTESQTSASRYPLSLSRGGNWTALKRETIALQLRWIRHWKVECRSFEEIENSEATWFIDPPYQLAGSRYRHNQIDYAALARWCRERSGQVIVCEQEPAEWLNFEPLDYKINRNASNKTYKEVVWTNTDKRHPSLF